MQWVPPHCSRLSSNVTSLERPSLASQGRVWLPHFPAILQWVFFSNVLITTCIGLFDASLVAVFLLLLEYKLNEAQDLI